MTRSAWMEPTSTSTPHIHGPFGQPKQHNAAPTQFERVKNPEISFHVWEWQKHKRVGLGSVAPASASLGAEREEKAVSVPFL